MSEPTNRPLHGRVLIDEPASGAWNMAVDESILDAVATGAAPPTLRFYRWHPPCLSLGYFQPGSVVNPQGCRQGGVDVVRRPTGGRAILHGDELTYSITLPISLLGRDLGVKASYRRLSRALLEGLRLAGYPVTVAMGSTDASRVGPACFDEPAANELLLDGKKVVGSAQLRRGTAMLQHGSILFSPQIAETLACLEHPPAAQAEVRRSLEASVGGLSSSHPADPELISRSIAAAFERLLGLAFGAGPLTAAERQTAAGLAATRYAPDAWMDREPAFTGREKATRTR